MVEFYGSVLDRDTCWEVFKENQFYMNKTLEALTKLTGIDPIKEENNSIESNPDYKVKIHELIGDLFTCAPSASLAHCISRDVKMGKGIAVSFKEKFGGVEDIKNQRKRIGEVAILSRNNRFIYYLITKENYWHKPTYEDLQRSLENMKKHMQENNVSSLAIPKLGCGLDGLLWPKVKKMLYEIFSDMDLNISVYSL